jgi:hypothetical protein
VRHQLRRPAAILRARDQGYSSGSSHVNMHCTALHCTALYCTALHCAALHCTLRRSVNRNSPPGLMPNCLSLS